MYRFPNFHECPYNLVETQRTSHVAYFINKILRQKQFFYFDHQNEILFAHAIIMSMAHAGSTCFYRLKEIQF